jgi:hypothetical protein
MRRLFSLDGPLPPVLLPICSALLSLAIAKGSAVADPAGHHKTHTFFISMNDGYGLSNCLTTASACGKVVADSWCSAKGYGKARAWGASADITASIGGKALRAPANSIAVTCNESNPAVQSALEAPLPEVVGAFRRHILSAPGHDR